MSFDNYVCCQLQGFKCSNPVIMIFKWFFFLHRWIPDRYHHFGSEQTWVKWQRLKNFALSSALEIDPKHRMLFCIISRAPSFWMGWVLLLCKGCSRCILWTHRGNLGWSFDMYTKWDLWKKIYEQQKDNLIYKRGSLNKFPDFSYRHFYW